MRLIETEMITQIVKELCIDANIYTGKDILQAMKSALETETLPRAKNVLETLIKNAEVAEREKLPICQDTGMVVVFVKIGANIHINGDIEAAINEGIRRGYKEGYFRNSIVQDPINRKNTGDNTPAVIHYEFTKGDKLEITVCPKGFGSENASAVRMLKPSEGLDGIINFVTETVKISGENSCPPLIIGVGVGGTMEKAALLSKKSLLRDINISNDEPFWAEAEEIILQRVNELNIGAAGYGGKTTALGVNVLTYPTHIAGLPVAVNIGCHVTRHKGAVI